LCKLKDGAAVNNIPTETCFKGLEILVVEVKQGLVATFVFLLDIIVLEVGTVKVSILNGKLGITT
jgi:hypothetical protein